ncbi:MAG: TonB-dependent receptor [Opitutaceae bacterium]|nr:TonB-dependent receptor [Opitutaceae bacterium]
MKTSVVRHLTLVATAAICLSSASGQLQTPATSTIPGSEPDKNDVVVMDRYSVLSSSIRESMITAQERKRERLEISDSIVADDINKLPDFSVTDALSRISGIQIDRERGEGNGNVAIRGISQTESLLNGREIFSAEGGSRQFNMAELPAEMLAGIDVYKTSAANIIEGGLGGTIDVRLRRPFDFKGLEAVASVRGIYGNLVDEMKFQYSALASNRFKVGSGELGVLVNFTYQERAWREDFMNPGTPATFNVAGIGNVQVPNGSYEGVTAGSRERSGVNAVVQYAPVKGLEIYAEGSFSELKTVQDTYGVFFTPSSSANIDPNSLVLHPGTKDATAVRFTDGVSVGTYDTVRDTMEKHRLFAIGAKWSKDAFSIKADLSYTDAYSVLHQEGLNSGNDIGAIDLTIDNRGKVASTSTSTDLADADQYKITSLSYVDRPYNGDMTALAVDAEYKFSHGFFTSAMGGIRYAMRNANNGNGMINTGGVAIGSSADGSYDKNTHLFTQPYTDYFTSGNSGSAASRGIWHGNQSLIRGNIIEFRKNFGITAPLPTEPGNGIMGRWNIDEDTLTAYVMGKFQVRRILDGALGVRFARTEENIDSARQDTLPDNSIVRTPLSVTNSYNDILPSLNVRFFLQSDFFLRASVSKTLTRPTLPDLAPSLSLTQMVEESQNTGSSGNPNLKPVRAWNLDISLEKYFSKSASAYLALFYKEVDDYISSTRTAEIYDGHTYTISRPENVGNGRVKGFEIGGQMFLDFLPGWLSGFGAQANYTYVDSAVDNVQFPYKVPLTNLSENSFNLILMYEYKKFSARVAYNWRDKFYVGSFSYLNLNTNTTTLYPQYMADYGWLDASVGYSFNKRIRLSIDGTNLLNTVRTKYVGLEHLKNNAWVNDVQFVASLTIRL